MKTILYLSSKKKIYPRLFLLCIGMGVLSACAHRVRNEVYMPDMDPSLTYQAQMSTLPYKREGISFHAEPVPGTFPLGAQHPNGTYLDAAQAKFMKNPYKNEASVEEGKKLYAIHCAVCHGEKLDGDGPLYKGGEGPFPARPATLLPIEEHETEGDIFYVISYGKNLMGPFRDRLSEKERWLIVGYIQAVNKK